MHSGLSALIQAADQLSSGNESDDPVPELVSPISNVHPGAIVDGRTSATSEIEGAPGGNFFLPSASTSHPLGTDDEELMQRAKNTFPGILMSLALDPQNQDTIAFLPDGKYFCMRTNRFEMELMPVHFGTGVDGIRNIDEFMNLAHNWGFRQVLHHEKQQPDSNQIGDSHASSSITRSHPSTDDSEIQVFRHPLFIKGDWRRCAAIQKFGDERLGGNRRRRHSAPSFPMGATFFHRRSSLSVEQEGQQDAMQPQAPSTILMKRQQSHLPAAPSTRHRKRLSLAEENMDAVAAAELFPLRHSTFTMEDEVEEELKLQRLQQREQSRRDSIRSVALSLTSEQLDLLDKPPYQHNGEDIPDEAAAVPQAPCPEMTSALLVDQAVKSATHTIVTDAIETLLQDELHTIVTYVKHEKELSRSSLPGVVPMSKQLFEPSSNSNSNSNTAIAAGLNQRPLHTSGVGTSPFSSGSELLHPEEKTHHDEQLGNDSS